MYSYGFELKCYFSSIVNLSTLYKTYITIVSLLYTRTKFRLVRLFNHSSILRL